MQFIVTENPWKIEEKKSNRRSWNNDVRSFIMEFFNSDYECIKVMDKEYASHNNLQYSLSESIRRLGVKNVECHSFKNEVYLVRSDKVDKSKLTRQRVLG